MASKSSLRRIRCRRVAARFAAIHSYNFRGWLASSEYACPALSPNQPHILCLDSRLPVQQFVNIDVLLHALTESSEVRDVAAMITINCNSAINAGERSSEWVLTSAPVGRTGQHRVEMNTMICNSAISACKQSGELAETSGLLERTAQQGVEMNNNIDYIQVISACEQDREWEEFSALSGRSAQHQDEKNSVIYSPAISASEQGGEWAESSAILGKTAQGGVEMDAVTYSSASNACELDGEWAETSALRGRTVRPGVDKNIVSCDSSVSPCDKVAESVETSTQLDRTAQREVANNTVNFNSAIIQAPDASEVLLTDGDHSDSCSDSDDALGHGDDLLQGCEGSNDDSEDGGQQGVRGEPHIEEHICNDADDDWTLPMFIARQHDVDLPEDLISFNVATLQAPSSFDVNHFYQAVDCYLAVRKEVRWTSSVERQEALLALLGLVADTVDEYDGDDIAAFRKRVATSLTASLQQFITLI